MFYLLHPSTPVLLPLAILVYWFVLKSPHTRLFFLVTASLLVLALWQPLAAVLSLLVSLWVFHIAKELQRASFGAHKKLFYAVVGAILFLLIGKYAGTILTAVLPQLSQTEKYLVAPLGLSYLVFRMLHYIFEHQRGQLKSGTYLEYLAYLFFLPLVPAGPIETYKGFYKKRRHMLQWDDLGWSIRRVLVGLFKKLLLVDLVLKSALTESLGRNAGDVPFGGTAPLIFAVVVFLRAYLDLSAYTDLALGLARLFGFRVMENFRIPLLSVNLAEFWRRWHISLSQWCKNHVYFPVLGKTRSPAYASLGTMLVMGLWHQVSAGWFWWGVFHGCGLALYGEWQRLRRRYVRVFRWVEFRPLKPVWVMATLYFVVLSFCFTAFPDFDKSMELFVACVVSFPQAVGQTISKII